MQYSIEVTQQSLPESSLSVFAFNDWTSTLEMPQFAANLHLLLLLEVNAFYYEHQEPNTSMSIVFFTVDSNNNDNKDNDNNNNKKALTIIINNKK